MSKIIGSEYGYGYGYGDGYGYGYGDGYGYGYGYGDEKQYSDALIDVSVGERASDLRASGAILCWWRAAKDGRPVNGGTDGKPRAVGTIDEITGPLELCTRRALHGTTKPWKWKGERLFIVALYPPVMEHEDGEKLGSLKREILAEVSNIWEGVAR